MNGFKLDDQVWIPSSDRNSIFRHYCVQVDFGANAPSWYVDTEDLSTAVQQLESENT